MLINDFFEVLESNGSTTSINTRIRLNAKHRIYDGHFPDNPVTPGVVLIQIVKELLGAAFNKEFQLVSMSRCKFLKILNPVQTPALNIKIDVIQMDDSYKINAIGVEDDNVFFKLSAVYK